MGQASGDSYVQLSAIGQLQGSEDERGTQASGVRQAGGREVPVVPGVARGVKGAIQDGEDAERARPELATARDWPSSRRTRRHPPRSSRRRSAISRRREKMPARHRPAAASPRRRMPRCAGGHRGLGTGAGDRRRACAKYPQDTPLNFVELPLIRAQVELNRGNPGKAIELLRTTLPYEVGTMSGIRTNYVRGKALLRSHRPRDATAEFRKIVDRRGINLESPLWPLAHLQLARAYEAAGDAEAGRPPARSS